MASKCKDVNTTSVTQNATALIQDSEFSCDLLQTAFAAFTCIEGQTQQEGWRSRLESGAEMEDWTPG